jgi:hypothetical protein
MTNCCQIGRHVAWDMRETIYLSVCDVRTFVSVQSKLWVNGASS